MITQRKGYKKRNDYTKKGLHRGRITQRNDCTRRRIKKRLCQIEGKNKHRSNLGGKDYIQQRIERLHCGKESIRKR